MKRILLMLIAATLLSSGAAAQEAPAELVAMLGSSRFAERDKASKKLVALGKSALPALRQALKADLETRRRAAVLIEQIEERILEKELLAATPIRLQFNDVPLDDALREADKRFDLRLTNSDRKDRITLDTGTIPYWQAWRRLRDAGELHESDYAKFAAKLQPVSKDSADVLLEQYRREADIRFKPYLPRLEFAASAPPSYAEDNRGSVRVRVRWHAASGNAVFAVEVRPEPRLDLVVIPRAEITRIVDDAGARAAKPIPAYPVPAKDDDADVLAAYSGEIQYAGLVQLKALAWTGPPRTLKELHGRVRLRVIAKPPMIELPDVAKWIGKEAHGDDGVRLKVLEVKRVDRDAVVRLRLENLDSLAPRTDKEKFIRVRPGVIAMRGPMDVVLERLMLLDATRRPCRLVQSRYEHLADAKSYEAALRFSVPSEEGENWTLVMTKAPRVVPLDAPFTVRDVVWPAGGLERAK